MPEPTVIDLFTSSATDTRTMVFSPGERIRFNVVHTLSNDLPLDTPYRATWIIERYDQAIGYEDNHGFDVLFSLRRMFSFDGWYQWRTVHTWFNFTLPRTPPTAVPIGGSRADILRFLESDITFALGNRGLWKTTVCVELTEAVTGHPFDVMDGWHYRVGR